MAQATEKDNSRNPASPAGRQSSDHAENPTVLPPAFRVWLSQLPLIVCVVIFLFHFSVIRKYAVNIPNVDDWFLLQGDNHPASLDLKWLHAQHNEHRPGTERIFVWLQFHLNGWNLRTHLFLDFLIYGLFLVFLAWFAKRFVPEVPFWVVASFLVFLLSPIIWINHFMAAPICVHFWVFFLFLSVFFMFGKSQSWPTLVVGCVAAALSINSFASGFITSLVVLVGYIIFKCLRAYRKRGKEGSARELLQVLLAIALIGGTLYVWTIGFTKPFYHPPLVFPYRLGFWEFFLNLVSYSFGIERISVALGVVCLLIILLPICVLLWKKRSNLSPAEWAVVVAVAALLANLGLISIGRAGFGLPWSKVEEYAEHGMPLLILSALNWSVLLRNRKRLKTFFLLALWLFCLRTFANNWDFDKYSHGAAPRREGVQCVKAYYEQKGDGVCPTIFLPQVSLKPFLDQAKRLNVSFYREMAPELRQQANRTSLVGSDDATTCHRTSGWAWNRSEPAVPGSSFLKERARLDPMNPAPPVISILIIRFPAGRSP